MSGFLCCAENDSDKEARQTTKVIDGTIRKDKLAYKMTMKLLLLGAGESGKSTFLKQMRIIHGLNFDESKILEFKQTIYSNIMRGMRVLIDAREKLFIAWGDPENRRYGKLIQESVVSNPPEEDEICRLSEAFKCLWSDIGIKEAFERRKEFQMTDSVQYFMDEVERIASKGYMPTTLDILHARRPTKGIDELRLQIKGVPFIFVDVGGQRSQRQKWFQCFDNVRSILFLTSSSEFDQVLIEDRQTNRMMEALNIFETIVNNKSFYNVSVILFLNKTDLLIKKLERQANISMYFPEFDQDPFKLSDVQRFMFDQHNKRRMDQSRPLFHHFTTAVDTKNIQYVFSAVKDIILQDNLKSLMLQ